MRRQQHMSVQGFLALSALALVAGCTAAPSTEPEAGPTTAPAEVSGQLTVLDWAGYDAPEFWTDFQQAYPSVDVGFEFGASDADIYSKMAAGDQADIFHPYTEIGRAHV